VDAVLQMRGLSSTPTPTDELNLCDSQYPVPADPQPPLSPRLLVAPPHTSPGTGKPVKQRGPGLRVSVRRDRKHARLVVTARCATPCKLGAYLMTRRTGERKLRTKSRTLTRRFKNGTQQLRVKLPAHGARLRPRAELIVVATDRSGASSRLTRKVLLP
jgi:hypothetical protein